MTYLLGSGWEFQDLTKIWPNFFGDTSLMSDMFTVATQLVKGCQTLVMDPTSLLHQSFVNTMPHTMMVHWHLLGSGWEFKEFRIWPKSGLTFWRYIIDVWHVHSSYTTCEGMSDLGDGPNKPSASIIGEYYAPYHDGALTSTWFRVRISGSDQNLA